MNRVYQNANGYQNQQSGNYYQPQGQTYNQPYQQGQAYQQPVQGAPYQQGGFNQPQGMNNNQPYQQGQPYQQPAQGAPYQQGGFNQPQGMNNPPQGTFDPYSAAYPSPFKPVYFTPKMREENTAGGERDLYGEFNKTSQDAPQQNVAAPENTAQQTPPQTGAQPQITVSEPEEPKEPDFAEMQEPAENFTERLSPRSRRNPKNLRKQLNWRPRKHSRKQRRLKKQLIPQTVRKTTIYNQ